MPTPKRLFSLLLSLFLILPVACQEAKRPPNEPGNGAPVAELTNPNVRFGLPAHADHADHTAYLIERPQYVLSYNGKKHDPNWVCWRLTHADIGKAVRGAFVPDLDLPPGIAKVGSHVYDGSGFDRGHMCPAQDRSSSQADMDATFHTTNIVPQAPLCNQRGWERLEHYSRELTKDHVLWIAAGPAGVGGEGKNGLKEEIGKGKVEVVVPAKVWKVILVLPHDTAQPTRATRTIAVIMPNNQSVDYDWAKYRCSVAEVEKLTGYHFWPALPGDLARALKEKVDEVKVHVPHPKKHD
jgi:endonuclease G